MNLNIKLESALSINGQVVFKVGGSPVASGFVALTTKDKETIYIVKEATSEVVMALGISCEYSQCSGYVDSIEDVTGDYREEN